MTASLPGVSDAVMAEITSAIRSIRHGSVQITIHDSRVVQIERAEKIRVQQDADLASGGAPRTRSRADRITGGSRARLGP